MMMCLSLVRRWHFIFNFDLPEYTSFKYISDSTSHAVSALLTVSPLDMRKVLTTVTVVTHGETIVRPLTIEHAMDIRDALAKVIAEDTHPLPLILLHVQVDYFSQVPYTYVFMLLSLLSCVLLLLYSS